MIQLKNMKVIQMLSYFIFFVFSSLGYCADLESNSQQMMESLFQNEKKLFPKDPTNEIEKAINLMYDADQKIRHKVIENEKLWKLVQKMDQFHLKQLKKILAKNGWLIISKYGKEIDQKTWLLVQHADSDPNFQASCAFLLEQLVPKGETDPKNFAYLYDRIAVKFPDLGIKQKYGTQARIEKNKIELYPYMGTARELNERRKMVGLDSIEQYLKTLEAFYKKHKKILINLSATKRLPFFPQQ